MKSEIRAKLAARLKKTLSASENRRARKSLQKARPHVLFLEDLNFINDTIRELVDRKKIRKDFKLLQLGSKDLKEAQRIASKYQDRYVTAAQYYKTGANNIENTLGGRSLKRKFPEVYTKVLKGEAFLFSSFDSIGKCKTEIISLFIDSTTTEFKKIAAAVDRGHGGGDGVAVSGTQIAKGFGVVDKHFDDDEEARKQFAKEFSDFIQNALTTGRLTDDIADDLIRIQIDYNQVVTPSGEISATYVPFITFQDKYTNRVTDKARETEAKKVIGEFFEKIGAGELASMHGSSSYREKMLSKAIQPLVEIKVKGAKISVESKIDPRKMKFKTGGTVKESNKPASTAKLAITNGKAAKRGSGRVTKATQSTYSTAALMGLFNSQLPAVVAKNMQYPALEYRTGRFSNSVKVVDIRQTTQGFQSIGYMYEKNPYQTFETGFKQGSSQRDPRVLIDRSIREIATELALGRLYTRRL